MNGIDIVNVWPIVKNNYCNIFEYSKIPIRDVATLVVPPVMVGFLGLVFQADTKFIELMVPILTIIFGFSFNAAILMARQETGNENDDRGKRNDERLALTITRGNTLYALLVGLLTLMASVVAYLVASVSRAEHTIAGITIGSEVVNAVVVALSVFVYFLLTHYFVVLLMVSRRLYILAEGGGFQR